MCSDLPLCSCVTLEKLLNLPEPHFPKLDIKFLNKTSGKGLVWGLREMTSIHPGLSTAFDTYCNGYFTPRHSSVTIPEKIPALINKVRAVLQGDT